MTHPDLRIVATDTANPALGHYSQAIVHAGTVYVATQLGRIPDDPGASAGAQARRALGSALAIVQAAGSSSDQVVRVTLYLADIADWEEVNGVYAELFGDHKPARGVIPCGNLHGGAKVAVDVIAAV